MAAHLESWSTLVKVGKDLGTISIENGSSSTRRLTRHSLEPVNLPEKRSTRREQNGLLQRLVAEPGLRVQWIPADGQSEVARGLAASKFLERTGVSILVLGDGPHRPVLRIVRP